MHQTAKATLTDTDQHSPNVTLILRRALWGSRALSLSAPLIALIIGNSLHSASMTFPEFQRGRFKQLLIREGRIYRMRRNKTAKGIRGARSWVPIGGHTPQYL